jgi:hypothetical protein
MPSLDWHKHANDPYYMLTYDRKHAFVIVVDDIRCKFYKFVINSCVKNKRYGKNIVAAGWRPIISRNFPGKTSVVLRSNRVRGLETDHIQELP